MGLMQRMEIRQGQSLVMTPQLLQAIKLLQLSHLDLVSYVEAELERNPLLETAEGTAAATEALTERDGMGDRLGEPDGPSEAWSPEEVHLGRGDIQDSAVPLDNVFPDESVTLLPPGADTLTLTSPSWTAPGPAGFDGSESDVAATLTVEPSLFEHLAAQLDLATANAVDRSSAATSSMDQRGGYFTEGCATVSATLGIELPEVERVLALVQGFQPAGIGARDLAECLAIQLRERDRLDPRHGGAPRAARPRGEARSRVPPPDSAASTTRISATCWPSCASSTRSPAAPSGPGRSTCSYPTCSCAPRPTARGWSS
jgi:RNA polymerase sigma-54 factor